MLLIIYFPLQLMHSHKNNIIIVVTGEPTKGIIFTTFYIGTQTCLKSQKSDTDKVTESEISLIAEKQNHRILTQMSL